MEILSVRTKERARDEIRRALKFSGISHALVRDPKALRAP